MWSIHEIFIWHKGIEGGIGFLETTTWTTEPQLALAAVVVFALAN